MAVRPDIILAGQPLDVQSALTGAINQSGALRTRGVREQLLSQQAQAGQQAIQQQQQQQAVTQGQYINQLATGLKDKPLDQRAAIMAQQIPALMQLGINPSQVLGTNLTDEGLNAVITQTQPFMQGGSQNLPAGLQTFNALTQGMSAEDVESARRIELGLDPRAGSVSGGKTVKMPDGTIRTFDPNTNTFGPVVEESGDGAEVVTPEQQIKAQAEATEVIGEVEKGLAVEEAAEKEQAIQEVQAQDPAAIAAAEAAELRAAQDLEKRNLAIDATFKVVDNINTVLSSDRLDDISGGTGVLPTFRPKTKDLLNTVQQLSSLLTVENMGVMSGVLSESDMVVIKGLANDIGIKFDDKGNVTGFSGSIDGTVSKLRQLKTEIGNRLRRQGYGLEGDIVTNPSTGERLQYTNKQWVAL